MASTDCLAGRPPRARTSFGGDRSRMQGLQDRWTPLGPSSRRNREGHLGSCRWSSCWLSPEALTEETQQRAVGPRSMRHRQAMKRCHAAGWRPIECCRWAAKRSQPTKESLASPSPSGCRRSREDWSLHSRSSSRLECPAPPSNKLPTRSSSLEEAAAPHSLALPRPDGLPLVQPGSGPHGRTTQSHQSTSPRELQGGPWFGARDARPA
mmetsp:Transcript_4405/g.11266  ORF Transcript_4405/g.11266 Transcript_4405/m.11266 type:complete len:209 (+) Transcript_4405:96-722(+)